MPRLHNARVEDLSELRAARMVSSGGVLRACGRYACRTLLLWSTRSLPRCMSRPSSAELFPSGRFPQVAVGVLALGWTAGRMRSGGSFVVVECGYGRLSLGALVGFRQVEVLFPAAQRVFWSFVRTGFRELCR